MNTASKATRSFIQGLDIDIMPKKAATHAAVDSLRPDPSQPRKAFDEDELNGLAASIKTNGILSAIGVLVAERGTYIIVFGERRWRAAKLAGLTEVPIAIVDPAKVNVRAVQLVENIQRARLSPEEIAVAMDELAQDGMKAAEIAVQLGMSKGHVSKFRAVMDMPPQLRERLNAIGMETAYQLFGLWKKDRAAVEAFLGATAAEAINRQAVARFAERLDGKDAAAEPKPGANGLMEGGSTASDPASSSAGADAPLRHARRRDDKGGEGTEGEGADTRVYSSDPAGRDDAIDGEQTVPAILVFVVQVGDEFGRLLIDRTGPDSKTALVSFNNGGEIRSVPLSDLTMLEIVGG